MELLEQGGWVLIVIFALSFFIWFLIIHKWLYLRSETKDGFDWLETAMSTLQQGSDEKMREACRCHPGLAGRMVLTALEISDSGRKFSCQHRKKILESENIRLRRYLALIAAAGSVLTLLGLLGTVLGMVKTFDALASQETGDTKALMAAGISQALITTEAGLVTALPVVLMYGLLSSWIRRSMDAGALAMKRLESIISQENRHV